MVKDETKSVPTPAETPKTEPKKPAFKRAYNFPALGITVEAGSLAEATKIAKNQVKAKEGSKNE